jgi:hypothetical protein
MCFPKAVEMKNSWVKFLLFVGMLVLSTPRLQGQVYKLKATNFTSKINVEGRGWNDWADWEDSDVLITMDMDKDRITIYSKEVQKYDIAEYEGKETDDDGDDIWSFFCINEDGVKCRVRLAKLNSQNGRNQVYVDFSDLMIVYNVFTLD